MKQCELSQRGHQNGFTLIELMVVIVILGILAGLVVPKLMDEPDRARAVKARLQIESLGTALQRYCLDSGQFPSTEQGLEALVECPVTGRIPQQYPRTGYMDRIPQDPWGNRYVYVSPGQHGDYDLACYGADGMPGGEGRDADIASWQES